MTGWREAIAALVLFGSGVLTAGYGHLWWIARDARAREVTLEARLEERQRVVDMLGETLRVAEPNRERRGAAASAVMERRGGRVGERVP